MEKCNPQHRHDLTSLKCLEERLKGHFTGHYVIHTRILRMFNFFSPIKLRETAALFHTVQDSQHSSLCLFRLLSKNIRKHRGTMEEATGEKDPEFPMQQRISRKVQVLTSTFSNRILTYGFLLVQRKMTKSKIAGPRQTTHKFVIQPTVLKTQATAPLSTLKDFFSCMGLADSEVWPRDFADNTIGERG